MMTDKIHIDEEYSNGNWLHSMRKPIIEKFSESAEEILNIGSLKP